MALKILSSYVPRVLLRGWNDIVNWPTRPANNAASRERLQSIHDQTIDYMNDFLNYYTDTGTTNHLVITPDPAFTSYTANMLLYIKTANACTGASDVNVSGLGVKAIKTGNGLDCVTGHWASGEIICLKHDGTNFQFIGKSIATPTIPGLMKPDNNTITIDSDGVIVSPGADKGNFLDKERFYYENVVDVATCDSAEGWAANAWSGTAGSLSINTTNFKTGGASVEVDPTANFGGINLVKALDLSKLQNGDVSSTSDYICFWIYISQANLDIMTVANRLLLSFFCDTKPTITNQYYFTITKSSLVAEWNCFEVKKSSFTVYGNPDWAAIKGIDFEVENAAVTGIALDNIQLIRTNIADNAPNHFQKKENGAYVQNFNINSGKWYLGKEYGNIVLRDLSPIASGVTNTASSFVGIKPYSTQFIAKMIQTIKVANNSERLAWEIDANNRISAYVSASNLYLSTTVAGTNNVTTTTAYTCAVGDVIEFELRRNGTTVSLVVRKNYDTTTEVKLTKEVSFSSNGYLALGHVGTNYANIVSMSITLLEHSAHSDVSEVAKTLAVKYKAGAFAAAELRMGEFGVDTANHRLYFLENVTTVKYAALT